MVATVNASVAERTMIQRLFPGDSNPRVESADALNRNARMGGLIPAP